MRFLEIWKRLGKQPIKQTKKEAIVFINGEEYAITGIRYNSGILVGFEAEPKAKWFSEMIKPKENLWVVVRSDYDDEHEYRNHQWDGHNWIHYIKNEDGSYSGRPTTLDITEWRYQVNEDND